MAPPVCEFCRNAPSCAVPVPVRGESSANLCVGCLRHMLRGLSLASDWYSPGTEVVSREALTRAILDGLHRNA